MRLLLVTTLLTLCTASFYVVSFIFPVYVVEYETFVLGVNTTTVVQYHLVFQETIRESMMNFGDDSPLETTSMIYWLTTQAESSQSDPTTPTRLRTLYLVTEFFIGFAVILLLTVMVLSIIRCCKYSHAVPNSLRVSTSLVTFSAFLLALISLLLVIFLQPIAFKDDCAVYENYIPSACSQDVSLYQTSGPILGQPFVGFYAIALALILNFILSMIQLKDIRDGKRNNSHYQLLKLET